VAVLASAGLATALSSTSPTAAQDLTTAWARAATAEIAPGVQMYTDGAQCTGNFVYSDGAGNTYVGYAAHCAGTGAATDTNGCEAASLPLGTRVRFARGGSLLSGGTEVGQGTLAYSSWLTCSSAGRPTPTPVPSYGNSSLRGGIEALSPKQGTSLGTLSTLAIAPLAGSNGVGDLSHELGYAQQYGGIAGLRLVPGTEPFSPLL
jgi:hypothetical protein